MTFNHDKDPFKRRMCIQEYYCMYSLGGEVQKMTCNRDKNSMKEEAANGGIPLHVGLGGVQKMTCNRDKNSMKDEAANGGIPLHVGLWGGSLENDLQS